ncbi:MAG: C1 family peptidase [Nostoc sp. EfeVER01]|uniref:C1 family peptidase n=1 Tax=unclassified Nostoc TaxID=2593658 RepID=UPI002AD389E9|nr:MULTISPECIES: C1 family peptidase [unclassified Nostoc]MDZ7947332.1 C1 family peptidase [Nostoc sp. EfeVER01]MDZ7994596.1 C1 family peptidase [Nostoc sp. EspVER01]
MLNQPENLNKSYDWKSKGLGWVPDYPDLRDYNLDDEDLKNQQRLKVEETTGWIENIIGEVLQLLNEDGENIQKSNINELKNKILGNVIFKKVRVHKLLRYPGFLEDNEKTGQFSINKVKYDSILSRQVIQLKKYLGVLLLTKYLNIPKKINSKSNYDTDKSLDLENPLDVIQWMNDETYDFRTKEIIEFFQCLTDIKQDGIVGLETFVQLNEYLLNPKKSKLVDANNKCKDDNSKRKPLKRIRYFSVTSLIPDKALNQIIYNLCLKVSKQISQEIKTKNFLEEDFLNSIKVNSDFFQKVLAEINTDTSIKNSNCLLRILEEGLTKPAQSTNAVNKNKSDIKSNLEFFKNSPLFDPLISIALRSIYPLAQLRHQTIEELIEQGIDNLENLIKQKPENFNEQQKPKLGYSNNELVKYSIRKILYTLYYEIQSLEQENQERQINKKEFTNEFINSFVLCFFIKKYLNKFEYTQEAVKEIEKEVAVIGNSDVTVPPRYNPFDKQELFEIVTEESTNGVNSNSFVSFTQQQEELFLSLNLYIPIFSNKTIKYLEEPQEDTDKDKKPFFQLPSVVDLSYWFSSVKDQGSLKSCTAFAAVSLLEYFANKNSKDKIEPSPMFLYKAARNKMKVKGDVGSSIRETMKALALFGVPPEDYWPYDENQVDEEPLPYCYAYAQNYKTLKYFLLDYAGITPETLLFQIKAVLSAGFPCIFGLTLYSSIYKSSNEKGHIPFPNYQEDKIVGGHTLVAVGYDDFQFVKCANSQQYSKGAFLVRNSWGTEWGVEGYGWLPYDYVLAGLTSAWWSLLKSEWFNENNFGFSGTGGEGVPGSTGT